MSHSCCLPSPASFWFISRVGLADESNTRILLDEPGSTLVRAAVLQYRPVNTDVLPAFVLLHLLFAPLLWLLLSAPNATLVGFPGAVCIGTCLWLERAGVAGWTLGFQSVGLAVACRARCVVDHRGQDSPAMGDVTHNARACRPVSAL